MIMKIIFKIILISYVIFGLIFFTGDQASAASIYDDAFKNTPSVSVGIPGCSTVTVTDFWEEFITNPDNYLWNHNSSQADIFTTQVANALNSGNFAVSEHYVGPGEFYTNFIFPFDVNNETAMVDEPMSFFWYPGYVEVGYDTNPTNLFVGQISITMEPNCDLGAYAGGGDKKLTISTSSGSNHSYVVGANVNTDIPDDYEGETVNQEVAGEKLTPEYTYNVNETGVLSVKYLGNLEYFLTGTSWLVIEKMTTNWDALDENLDSILVQPAGSLDEKYELPGPGYYMLRIDHNQQLDSPPWPEDNELAVGQVWIQFYWNGSSPITGDNIGGCGNGICNDQKQVHDNKILRAIEQAQFSDGGLQGLIFAPINAIAILPTLGDSCTPINLPLLGENVIMQCIRPMVQASPFGPVYATVSVIITGLMTWWVSLKTFALIKGLQDPDDDKVEVLKL